jgi:hypothetical protein
MSTTATSEAGFLPIVGLTLQWFQNVSQESQATPNGPIDCDLEASHFILAVLIAWCALCITTPRAMPLAAYSAVYSSPARLQGAAQRRRRVTSTEVSKDPLGAGGSSTCTYDAVPASTLPSSTNLTVHRSTWFLEETMRSPQLPHCTH